MGKKRQGWKFSKFNKNIEGDYADALTEYGEARQKAQQERIMVETSLFSKKARRRKAKQLKKALKLEYINQIKNGGLHNSLTQIKPNKYLNHLQSLDLVNTNKINIKNKFNKENGWNNNVKINGNSHSENGNKANLNRNRDNSFCEINGNINISKNIAHAVTTPEKRKLQSHSELNCKMIKKNVNGQFKGKKESDNLALKSRTNGLNNIHSRELKTSSNGITNGHSNILCKSINIDRKSIQQQRKQLPMFEQRGGFLHFMSTTKTLILVGETGSGKTTQIPQYIHEEKLDLEGAICITQPRRVAAITVAKRVADEMRCEIGTLVGYSVRFEEACSEKTKLKFVTDGMLLREALSDPLLTKYKWVILDEAHERSVNADALFGIVKTAQRRRNFKKKFCPLHVIIMSATLDVDHFHLYFENSVVKAVEGREYEIQVRSLIENSSNYVLSCMQLLTKIQREAKEGEDVLIFLTGQEEIEYCIKLIEQTVQNEEDFPSYPHLQLFPLYAALPYHKQLQVFAKTPPGFRKVIFSTDIAETSVTIPGVKYVIDSGRVKRRCYNAASGFEELKVCKISQSQACQRTGRAGREGPGVCYRAYTAEEFKALSYYTVPEILRSNLTSVTLRLMAIGIRDIVNFDFIDKPKKENLIKALENLIGLEAVQCINESNVLTELGKKMAYFPVEPQYAKLIINGPKYSCTEEMLTIVALLSSESVYITPSDKRDEVYDKRLKFQAMEGDHIELLNVYKAFVQATNKKKWCGKNFLNFRNLNFASNVRRQLSEICSRQNIPLVSSDGKIEQILKCLVSGLYKNVAEKDFENRKANVYKVFSSNEEVRIHPASRLFNTHPDYVVFTELVKTQKAYMHIVTEVRPEYLLEVNETYFRAKRIKKDKSVKMQYI